ncbi:alpha/beta fold hydrolase [Amycolatopsis regifaucium]|uniref:Alpha/beta hydrolase n=1 Tax=Amycolatopsis regifaucium TaxID=546365 RepID=A0A154MCL7_9PSEU|nr:alpha/beta hydrolase [Amycolatopsis regifaucium]KZB82282.1 alpha/beta hydrolase [Amycolatopsis regifaucium]OKA05647.1 alpha/beta hydrolase [Amycolatopsis regifaucium]SFG88532.1 Pimeloyl-ACP methyl ester carboxylesterase [Amycolatopsis regifaucium]
MVKEFDVDLGDGATLHAYDTGGTGSVVFWHHGTPNIGAPPAPLLAAAERLGLRWVSHDRPGYGGSTPRPGRTIASAASDVAKIADALEIENFAVFGHSGGGPHALACAALLPERVSAVVGVASMAPYDVEGLDWFAGMGAAGVESLTAALAGRAEKADYEASAEYDAEMFTASDHAALKDDWAWILEVVGPAVEGGPGGLIDDDLAYVAPWGFQPSDVEAPVLLLHGGADRIAPLAHGEWLARQCPTAELRRFPEEGHVSVLRHGEGALEWLAGHR